ncbi:MAG: hypothetical protein JST20_04980 [Bacteroidetes bacterium]|nr:hypothetical protein [Bacteroidota bacterium]
MMKYLIVLFYCCVCLSASVVTAQVHNPAFVDLPNSTVWAVAVDPTYVSI